MPIEEISDVLVVLTRECAQKLGATTSELRDLGMTIEQTDADNGVVEGTIATGSLAVLRKLPCVDYVRVEFTYVARHPPDEARGQIGPRGPGV